MTRGRGPERRRGRGGAVRKGLAAARAETEAREEGTEKALAMAEGFLGKEGGVGGGGIGCRRSCVVRGRDSGFGGGTAEGSEGALHSGDGVEEKSRGGGGAVKRHRCWVGGGGRGLLKARGFASASNNYHIFYPP